MLTDTTLVVGQTDFSGFPFGGTEATLEELLKALPEDVARETVLVGISRGEEDRAGTFKREIGSSAFRFVPVMTVARGRRAPLRAGFVRGILRCAGALTAFRPRLVYAHSPEAALALSIAMPTCPIVLHSHGTENPIRLSRYVPARYFPFPQLYDLAVMGPALKRARRVIVTADSLRFESFTKKWSPRDGQKFVRMPSMVSADTFHPMDRTQARLGLGLAPTDFVVGCVARLEPGKGIDVAIRAVALLNYQALETHIVVVGDGSQRSTLEAIAQNLGIQHRAHFLGYVPRRSLAAHLSACDVFVTASWKEGFSVALLEALACGVPVVSTDVGGAGEVVRDGETGFIAQASQPDLIAALLCKARRTGHEMRERCVTVARDYSPGRIVPRILDVLDAAKASRAR